MIKKTAAASLLAMMLWSVVASANTNPISCGDYYAVAGEIQRTGHHNDVVEVQIPKYDKMWATITDKKHKYKEGREYLVLMRETPGGGQSDDEIVYLCMMPKGIKAIQ